MRVSLVFLLLLPLLLPACVYRKVENFNYYYFSSSTNCTVDKDFDVAANVTIDESYDWQDLFDAEIPAISGLLGQ